MILKIKNYKKVDSLQEAHALLQSDKKNLIIGGGAWLKQSNKEVNTMIDLDKLALATITEDETAIKIGAMTTLRQLEISKTILAYANGILGDAVSKIMGLSIRNLATIGGSIMGKYPFSDILTPLIVMNVDLEFYSAGMVTLDHFINNKPPNDILLSVIIHKEPLKGYVYTMKKTALDFAVVNVAITKGDSFNIAIGARPGLCALTSDAMTFINNQTTITDEIINKTANIAIKETTFGTNSRASKAYRERISEVYIRRGLKEVISNEN